MISLQEKRLYHQIHPLKLLVDITTGSVTTYFLWAHRIQLFLIFFLLPSVIISIALIRFADLEPMKRSRLGKYISNHMTGTIEAIRLAGQMIMWAAAWFHSLFFIATGFLIILGGWFNGPLSKILRGSKL